jgi:hypothetical protein
VQWARASAARECSSVSGRRRLDEAADVAEYETLGAGGLGERALVQRRAALERLQSRRIWIRPRRARLADRLEHFHERGDGVATTLLTANAWKRKGD